jgi:phosphoenolpyruvate phosphomutase
VGELFRLQGADELEAAEERYLPRGARGARAIVLAASRGEELGELTRERPKAMVAVGGKPLLAHIVDAYNAVGIKDVTVVRGYAKAAVDLAGPRYVDNDEYGNSGELHSLQCALRADARDDQPLLVSYGDVLFKKYVAQLLCESEADLAVVVDTDWRESANKSRSADWVQCSAPHAREDFYRAVALVRCDPGLPEDRRHGEWMGFLKIAPRALPAVRAAVDALVARDRHAKLPQLLEQLVAGGERVAVLYTTGHWYDVDSVADVVAAGERW